METADLFFEKKIFIKEISSREGGLSKKDFS